MLTLKVTSVDSAEGVSLPKEACDLLGVQTGDRLHLTRAPDGALRITPYDPEFERQWKLAERILHDDREILRALAK